MMTEELFSLYRRCFPGVIREEKKVREVLSFPENRVLTRREGDTLIAGLVLHRNVALLFCVLPEHREKGVGSSLLEEAEALAREAGFAELKFCDGPDYIAPGVPLYEGNREFFEKRGYVHSWSDCECVDMEAELARCRLGESRLGDSVNGVLYRWALPSDREAVKGCVQKGWPPFVQYYDAPEKYVPGAEERVSVAEKDGEIAGCLLVGRDSVGCTVTAPEHQRQGIATNLVKLGTAHLRDRGLKKAFLGYTYTDIVRMYERSGYQISMKYFMGVKKLTEENAK